MYNENGKLFEGDFSVLSAYVASIDQVGNFLEFLKENDCYDNSRIIITSDHGMDIHTDYDKQYYKYVDEDKYIDIQAFNPLLLVKDFEKHGHIKTSEELMTNADTPYLLLKDAINDPIINPYTGNEITMEYKKNKNFDLLQPKNSTLLLEHTTFTYQDDGYGEHPFNNNCYGWYKFTGDDVFDFDNWSIDYEYEKNN